MTAMNAVQPRLSVVLGPGATRLPRGRTWSQVQPALVRQILPSDLLHPKSVRILKALAGRPCMTRDVCVRTGMERRIASMYLTNLRRSGYVDAVQVQSVYLRFSVTDAGYAALALTEEHRPEQAANEAC